MAAACALLLLAVALPDGGTVATPAADGAPEATGTPVTVVAPPALPTSPAPLTIPSPAVTPRRPAPPPLREAPLAELSADAATLALRQPGRMAVAVVVPERSTLYLLNGTERFHMASIVKLVILLATIQKADDAGRMLTLDEREWLEPMITWSDNDSADVLWWRLGGAAGIQAFLDRHALNGFEMDPDGYWGDSWATPQAVAQLLSALVWGDIVPPWGQVYARELLENVTQSQRWGATGAAAISPGDLVGVKDGWYPEETGWEVNSAGYLLSAEGTSGYAIAVLSDRQADFDEAVDAIEAIGSAVRRSLRGR